MHIAIGRFELEVLRTADWRFAVYLRLGRRDWWLG